MTGSLEGDVRDTFEHFIEKVEDLNKNIDIMEKDNDTNAIPSPSAPLLKVVRRVILNGIIGEK